MCGSKHTGMAPKAAARSAALPELPVTTFERLA